MVALTSRGGFPFPEGADNRKQIRTHLTALANRLAAAGVVFGAGPLADRPAASADRRLTFWLADTGALGVCTGAAWLPVLTDPAAFVSRAGGDTIVASGPAVRPLIIRGATGQTANLQEWQDQAGGIVARVLPTGSFAVSDRFVAENVIPLDGDVNVIVFIGGVGLRRLVVGAPDSAGPGRRQLEVRN